MFPVDPEIYHGSSSSSSSEIGIEDLEQADPTATRFFVHAGKSCLERLRLPTPGCGNSLYFEPIVVKINRGIRFGKRKRSLLFRRHSLQHVLSVLGTPDQVHVKEADSMRIHRPSDGKQGKDAPGERDYFLNYFKLGMDILIDGAAHMLKKIILHTNMPATRNFNRYNRCNYQIMVSDMPAEASSSHPGGQSSIATAVSSSPSSSSSSSTAASKPMMPGQRMVEGEGAAGTAARAKHSSKSTKKKVPKNKKKKLKEAVGGAAGKSRMGRGAVKEAAEDVVGGVGKRDMPQNALCLPSGDDDGDAKDDDADDDDSEDSTGNGAASTEAKSKKDHQSKSEEKSKAESSSNPQPRVITFSTRWEEVQQILGEAGRPMVYGGAPGLLDYPRTNHGDDRKSTREKYCSSSSSSSSSSPCVASDNKLLSRPIILGGASELNRLNPFKSTYFYPYPGIIFEVIPNNNHIASIILFAT